MNAMALSHMKEQRKSVQDIDELHKLMISQIGHTIYALSSAKSADALNKGSVKA